MLCRTSISYGYNTVSLFLQRALYRELKTKTAAWKHTICVIFCSWFVWGKRTLAHTCHMGLFDSLFSGPSVSFLSHTPPLAPNNSHLSPSFLYFPSKNTLRQPREVSIGCVCDGEEIKGTLGKGWGVVGGHLLLWLEALSIPFPFSPTAPHSALFYS